MAGPRTAANAEKPRKAPESTPPGHFLSPELASDCARFVAEAKERARRRAEAERRGPPRR
jgi:hypothetical protein